MKNFEKNLYRITLMIMSVASIIAVGKVINSYYFYINYCETLSCTECKIILTAIIGSITIVLILLGTIYTIVYVHSMLVIPFKAPYFLVAILFITFPLFISLSSINSFSGYLSYNKYLEYFFPNGMISLNLCFIFLILYVLVVFRAERKYFDKEFTDQSMVLLIFHGSGIGFTNVFIYSLMQILNQNSNPSLSTGWGETQWVQFIFIFSILSVIVSGLFLFLAIAFELKIKFKFGHREA